jgi:hypothetical protein
MRAIEETVRILNESGLSVRWVCTEGDSTYVQKACGRLLYLTWGYDFRLPAHRQTALRSRVMIGEQNARYLHRHRPSRKGREVLICEGSWSYFPPLVAMAANGLSRVRVCVVLH